MDYPGAVEDMSNLEGIPAVTCEVLSPHGTADSETIDRFIQSDAIISEIW